MHAGLDRRCGLLVCDDDTHRNAAGHRFGRDDNVGQQHRIEQLICEVGTGAAHAALKAAGANVDDEVSRYGGPVPPMFWLRDPDGNSLIVVEPQS